MRSKNRAVVIFISLSLGFFGSVSGQTISSYSALGIGDLHLNALAHNQGMGGLGISNSNVLYQNVMNPALLPENAIYSFGAGFSAEDKSIWQGNNREKASGGRLGYLSMILPLVRGKVAMNIAMSPYSTVNYNFKSATTVVGNDSAEMVLYNKGEGGFNQVSISSGLKLTKGLYVGGKASYIIGSIDKERNNVLTSPEGIYVPTSITKLTANDFLFGVGGVYRYYFTNNLSGSIGFIYDFPKDLSVTRSQVLEVKSVANIPVQIDTVYDDESGYLHIPETLGIGFSIHKLNRWMFGTDIRLQKWGDYRNFDGNNNNLVNARLIRIGGEVTPDATSVDNYFARVTYRVGFNFDQTPYVFNNTQINEFGINFGLTLPVSNFSSADIGFRYGVRGTVNDNLIQENFFRIYFGITFNDNRWFVRPKFN